MWRALLAGVMVLLAACGFPTPPSSPGAPVPERCGMISVHVVNNNMADVQVMYGGEQRREWTAPGNVETTHFVSRYQLRRNIGLWILRGGFNEAKLPVIETESVLGCEATLRIGPAIRWSYFYGDDVRRHW